MERFLASVFFLCFCSVNAQKLSLNLKSAHATQDSILSVFNSEAKFNDVTALKAEFNNVINELHYKGFFNLRYSPLKSINDSVFQSEIDLRRKYSIVKILNHDAYAQFFQNDSPYIKVENISGFLNVLLNELSKQGKPFSQIQLKNIQFKDSDTISAEIELDISKKRTLDDIVIRGYEKFPEVFLKHFANIKKAEVFDREKLIEQSEKLDLLRFVEQKQTPQVQFSKDSTKLFLYLERKQANSFDGFVGFNNAEDREFQLNGNVDLSLNNNFHIGEEIRLNYKNDGNAQEWFDVNLRLPYILQSKFSLGAGLGLFRQDSIFSNASQFIKIDYQVRPYINIGLKTAFENSSALSENNIQNQNINDFRKSRYSVEALYNKPKQLNKLFLNAQYLSLGLGLSQRDIEAQTQNQFFVELNARQIFKLNKRQFVFAALNAAYLDSDAYVSNELYRFGGVNTMRGFLENQFFAHLYGTLQTEYRYILGSNLYVHSVLDYGFYENDINRFSENLYSVGFGIGLETQAGVLRLILANGGSDSQNFEFRNTQIHLKFISVF